MSDQELRDMGMMAGAAEMSLNEIVRARGESLSLTLQQIRQLRGLLTMLEADARVQANNIQVAIAENK